MIPFASQRASGQDLATHLLNEHDNEKMEVASVRGAIAQDLHGAFAEWEALAHALTRCRKYLYSLSINPDPAQGPLTREQYADYIDRVEDRLGLAGQPRAVIFHIKPDKDGRLREHCHVVWSRVDVENEKAVHIAFDREKLMMVTREFARDHDLRLPDGYDRDAPNRDEKDHHRRNQLSLYEKAQQDRTGLTRDQRMAEVTEAWRQSDSASAFVRALEERGYILANGRRPYVLIDRYGEMNALPKLIDDRNVRTKDIRAFLEKDFPPEALPGVDQARALAAQHRKAREDFDKSQRRQDRLAQLNAMHAERRQALEKESAALRVNHVAQDFKLAARQQDQIRALEMAFHEEMERVRRDRAAHRPTGLAAFLGRVTGMAFVIRTLQKRQDRRRRRKFLKTRTKFAHRHKRERKEQEARRQMQRLDMARRFRALDQIEQRELRSLDTELLREGRVRARMRGQTLDSSRKQGDREQDQQRDAADHRDSDTYIDLQDAFDRAAEDGRDDGDDDGEGDSESRSPKPKSASKHRSHGYKRSSKNKNTDRDR